MNNNKVDPELIKKMNDEQINILYNTMQNEMIKGSPEERKIQTKLRLLKKMNNKEYNESIRYKRKNSRFS